MIRKLKVKLLWAERNSGIIDDVARIRAELAGIPSRAQGTPLTFHPVSRDIRSAHTWKTVHRFHLPAGEWRSCWWRRTMQERADAASLLIHNGL